MKKIMSLVLFLAIFLASSIPCFALSPSNLEGTDYELEGQIMSKAEYENFLGNVQDTMIRSYLEDEKKNIFVSSVEKIGNQNVYSLKNYPLDNISTEELMKDLTPSNMSAKEMKIYEVYGIIDEESFQREEGKPNYLKAYSIITGVDTEGMIYEPDLDKTTLVETEKINSVGDVFVHISYNKHKIVQGDNLSEIAQKYDTTVEELARINDISNCNLIYAGEYLFLR